MLAICWKGIGNRCVNLMRPVAWGMAAAAALPVGYVIKQHVDWESSPQSKKRMLVHQLAFWSALAIGLVLLHRKVLRNPTAGVLVRTLYGVAAGIVPVLGFEGGGRLAMAIFPKPTESFAERLSTGKRYVPSYLRASV